MKKIFTKFFALIGLMLIGGGSSAWADAVKYLYPKTAPASGAVDNASVSGLTITYLKDYKTGTPYTWMDTWKSSGSSITVDGQSYSYYSATNGSGNPLVATLDGEGAISSTANPSLTNPANIGIGVKLNSEKDATITVTLRALASNKNFFVVGGADGSKNPTDLKFTIGTAAGSSYSDYTNGAKPEDVTGAWGPDGSGKATNNNVTFKFSVEAGVDYTVFVAGSKMGFQGLTYEQKGASNNANIGSIKINGSIDATTTNGIDYTAEVLAEGNQSFSITPAHDAASVYCYGTSYTPGAGVSYIGSVALDEQLDIKVEAEDGTEKNYTLTVTQKKEVVTSSAHTWDFTQLANSGTSPCEGLYYDTSNGMLNEAASETKLGLKGIKMGSTQNVHFNKPAGVAGTLAVTFGVRNLASGSITLDVNGTASTQVNAGARSIQYFAIADDATSVVITRKAGNEGGIEKIVWTPVGTNVPVTISVAEWATFVAPCPVDFTDNAIKAYAVSAINAESVSLTEVTTVPAGEAVIVNGATGTVRAIASADPVTNLMEKTTDATAATGQLVLAQVDGEVVFAPATSGTIAAGKGYLPAQPAGARLRMVIAGDVTGINEVNVNATAPAKRIVNGKLVIEKAGKMFNAAGAQIK